MRTEGFIFFDWNFYMQYCRLAWIWGALANKKNIYFSGVSFFVSVILSRSFYLSIALLPLFLSLSLFLAPFSRSLCLYIPLRLFLSFPVFCSNRYSNEFGRSYFAFHIHTLVLILWYLVGALLQHCWKCVQLKNLDEKKPRIRLVALHLCIRLCVYMRVDLSAVYFFPLSSISHSISFLRSLSFSGSSLPLCFSIERERESTLSIVRHFSKML